MKSLIFFLYNRKPSKVPLVRSTFYIKTSEPTTQTKPSNYIELREKHLSQNIEQMAKKQVYETKLGQNCNVVCADIHRFSSQEGLLDGESVSEREIDENNVENKHNENLSKSIFYAHLAVREENNLRKEAKNQGNHDKQSTYANLDEMRSSFPHLSIVQEQTPFGRQRSNTTYGKGCPHDDSYISMETPTSSRRQTWSTKSRDCNVGNGVGDKNKDTQQEAGKSDTAGKNSVIYATVDNSKKTKTLNIIE